MIFQQSTGVYSSKFHDDAENDNPPCFGDPTLGTDYLGYPTSEVNFSFDFRDVTYNFFTRNDTMDDWDLAASGRVTENMPILEITGNILIDLD